MARIEKMNFTSFIEDFDEVIDKWLLGCRRHGECYSVLARLNGALRPEAKILEYGAWPGLYCVYVNARFGSEVWAIDNWQYATKIVPNDPEEWLRFVATYNRSMVHARYGDICHTEFPDEFFDVVYSLGAHEHIPDDSQALREIARILKDDGLCSITVDFAAEGWAFLPDLPARCYDRTSIEELIACSPFAFAQAPEYAPLEALTQGNTVQNPKIGPLCILLKKRDV